MSKNGLVLEGGGMRGLYTCGILDTFMEKGILGLLRMQSQVQTAGTRPALQSALCGGQAFL